jgi:hypothetical protein
MHEPSGFNHPVAVPAQTRSLDAQCALANAMATASRGGDCCQPDHHHRKPDESSTIDLRAPAERVMHVARRDQFAGAASRAEVVS